MLTLLQKAGAIALFPQMTVIDAMQMEVTFYRVYGETIDWHEFSSLLDNLRSQGLLRVHPDGFDGMIRYELAT